MYERSVAPVSSQIIGLDVEPFDGLPLDEPLIDSETWEKAGRALVATVWTQEFALLA